MTSYEPIHHLLARMDEIGARMEAAEDDRRHFHLTYLRTTRAVAAALEEGFFLDGPWVEGLDVVFGELYLDALESWESDASAPEPWAVTFAAATDPRLPPLRHVLLGMNAHINYDLPQALIATISDDEFDDQALIDRRHADHRRIDEILVGRVAEEDRQIAAVEEPDDRTLVDRLLTPLNRVSTRRFLTEARRKVWRNARLLNTARREGRLEARLEELESLARRRVLDLEAPGQVVLRLALHGFGVELSGDPGREAPPAVGAHGRGPRWQRPRRRG